MKILDLCDEVLASAKSSEYIGETEMRAIILARVLKEAVGALEFYARPHWPPDEGERAREAISKIESMVTK